MNARTGIQEHVIQKLRRYSARCVAGLMIAGMIVVVPMQTGYALTEETDGAEAVKIEESITAEEEMKAEAAEVVQDNEAVPEAAEEAAAEIREAESPAPAETEEAAETAEISDAEVPMAAEAEDTFVIEDEAVPMVLSADVYENDEMKEEAEDIDITVKGMFTKGTGVKAWPVKAEGNEFAAYEIVITDADGKEIHSESGDGNAITVTINDPELTGGLEARKNISGSHKDNGGNKDADFGYEILDDGGVRFEADVF